MTTDVSADDLDVADVEQDDDCRCDGICECGITDPSWAAEWDWVDASGGGW